VATLLSTSARCSALVHVLATFSRTKVGEVHGSATKSMNKNRQSSDTDNSATRGKR
jgi:hypothetical protein